MCSTVGIDTIEHCMYNEAGIAYTTAAASNEKLKLAWMAQTLPGGGKAGLILICSL